MYKLKISVEEFKDLMMDVIDDCIDKEDGMIDLVMMNEVHQNMAHDIVNMIANKFNMIINKTNDTKKIYCKKKAKVKDISKFKLYRKGVFNISLILDGRISNTLNTKIYEKELPIYSYNGEEFIDVMGAWALLNIITNGNIAYTILKEKISLYDYRSSFQGDEIVLITDPKTSKVGLFIKKSDMDTFVDKVIYKYIRKFEFNNK